MDAEAGKDAPPPPAPAAGNDAQSASSAAGIEGGSLDDYVIEKAIGRGHFSVVHRAVRKSDEKRVALKKVQIFDMMDAKARDRCLKEVQLLKALPPHPHMIGYLASFIDNNELYIVFEWAEHGDLRRLLRKANESGAKLQEAQVWRYFSQVTDGIRHMHEFRVMHRDIKPANIFLTSGGNVKLGDLGLGRAFSSQTYEALSKVGTPLYMSPEVLDGRGYEWKSDVWSLGCLLYELAALRSPFKGEGDNLYTLFKKISAGKYEELPPHFSPALSSLIKSMIAIDPVARPDIHTVCAKANEALAAFAAEAAAAERAAAANGQKAREQGGVGAAIAAVSDCLIVMEAVADKLKLLNYESELLRPHGLAPLPIAYFTGANIAATADAQLQYLYPLVCWLMDISVAPGHGLWRHAPRAASAEAEAQAACAAMLEALATAPPPLSQFAGMPPHRLRGARGGEVCALLNSLTDAALGKAGFDKVWATPYRHPGAGEATAWNEVDEEDDGTEGELHWGGGDADESALDSNLASSGEGDLGEEEADGDGCSDGGDGAAGGRRGRRSRTAPLPVLPPPVGLAVAWGEECARLAPQLALRVTWDQLHWRHRLALAQLHAPSWERFAPEVRPPLEKLVEAADANTSSLLPMQREKERVAALLDDASEELGAAQARSDGLQSELVRLDAEVERTKEMALGKGSELSGQNTAPIDNMRGGLRILRADVARLRLREALVGQELASLRARRVERDGTDAPVSGAARARRRAGSESPPDDLSGEEDE